MVFPSPLSPQCLYRHTADIILIVVSSDIRLKDISMNYIIIIMTRSEKLVTVVSLGISEAGPRDMGEYECQVSFTNKISRQTIAH